MDKLHTITQIKFENDSIIINIDGLSYTFKLAEISDKLASATNEEKNHYHISPSGYGIHWSKLDEDISIEGLLKK
jgi:hypothetical protein